MASISSGDSGETRAILTTFTLLTHSTLEFHSSTEAHTHQLTCVHLLKHVFTCTHKHISYITLKNISHLIHTHIKITECCVEGSWYDGRRENFITHSYLRVKLNIQPEMTQDWFYPQGFDCIIKIRLWYYRLMLFSLNQQWYYSLTENSENKHFVFLGKHAMINCTQQN